MGHDTGHPNERFCASPNKPNGISTCRGYDPITKRVPTVPPMETFCGACLDGYARIPGWLIFDWYDLEQLNVPVLSQTLDTHRGGRDGPPIPIAVGAEALQAEIHHVLTTWELEVRIACRLSDPPELTRTTAAPWHTTVTNRQPFQTVRPGNAVARAARIIEPRIRLLSNLPATEIPRTGCEDDLELITGADAVLHLAQLHQRSRAMLGRTRRIYWTPGECWQQACATLHRKAVAAHKHERDEWLYKSEPRWAQDEQPVYCRYCDEARTEPEYRAYVRMLVWPQRQTTEVTA